MTGPKFEFSANDKQFVARLNAMLPRLAVVVRRSFREIKVRWETGMIKRFTGWYPGKNRTGSAPAGRLRARTQALKGSARATVSGKNLTARVSMRVGGGKAGYAALQEFGGVITPNRGGGALTIPFGDAMTAAGRPREKARLFPSSGSSSGWSSGYGDTFLQRKGKNMFVFAKDDGGKVRALYLLRRSVEIAPRLGAGHTVNVVAQRMLPKMVEEMGRVLQGGGK